MIQFVCYGDPQPKQRPRFYRRGNFTGTYTPKPTMQAEQDLRTQALAHRPAAPLCGPLVVILDFYRAIPKSFSATKAAQAEGKQLRPTTRPDCDNFIKLVLDAFNGIMWHDDAQIVQILVNKFYSYQPRTEISIEQLTLKGAEDVVP